MTTKSYSSLLTWFGLTIIASLMLYHTSDRVNALDRQLRDLNSQIEAEQQSLHVLKAEWVYLANPARVEAAARRHLALAPTPTNRVLTMNDIGDLLPLRDGVAPVAVAENTAAPARPDAHNDIAQRPARRHTTRIVASNRDGHVNDRMIMQHPILVEASTDSIGGLIGTLGLHP
ncbi:MAG: hypothetical protein P4M15_12930 [Alphaproteobacteria bacterium]|nr:hypothetical protein [Alphaproteobacteria bacterium]